MSISTEIASMKTQTAITEAKTETKSSNDVTDSNMFLKLMLKQMEQQDPTEPTDNSQWLAQMAQYSSLEAMNNLNDSFKSVAETLSSMNENILQSSSISQTLSLVGKDVTISVPEIDSSGNPVLDEKGNPLYTTISGNVTEASFDDGAGMVTVNGEKYPISYVQTIKNPS